MKILVHKDDAEGAGIHDGDTVFVGWKELELYARAVSTHTEIERGELGLFEDLWDVYNIPTDEIIGIRLIDRPESIEYIKKKVLGKKLTEKELKLIMKEMGNRKMKEVYVAFFLATFFNPGFDEDEVLWLTKGMAESGDIMSFRNVKGNGDMVVDKHSIGGVAGKGVTPTLVPVIAACDLVIPNTSTRAITSPAGTSDILEVMMPVSLGIDEVMEVVKKTGACLIWGGGLALAPADDVLIHVERGIHLESYQKVLVSIVAKKIAMGISHIVIDIPYGKGTKVESPEDVELLEREFLKLFEKVGIKCIVHKRIAIGPDGKGIGPNLETIEVLRILEQDDKKSKVLEDLSMEMAGKLLEMSGKAEEGKGVELARSKLESGEALKKFWEIAKAQGAQKVVKSGDIELGKLTYDVKADFEGKIKLINNKRIVKIARALGTPIVKEAGIQMHKMPGENIKHGDLLMTLYARSDERLEAGKRMLDLEDLVDLAV